MKIISIPSTLRFTVPDDITDDQINALVRNAASEAEPSVYCMAETMDHLLGVCTSDNDKELIKSINIDEVDVWVDDHYTICDLND